MKASALWIAIGLATQPQASEKPELGFFFTELKTQAQAARQDDRAFVEGKQGWLFLARELEAFYDQSRPTEFKQAFEAIVDFHSQLQAAGIELLLVPVPFKSALYAEKLAGVPAAAAWAQGARLDSGLQQLYRRLGAKGVQLVDLLPLFQQQPESQSDPLYCRTDSHWSGRGLELTSQAIAERIGLQSWAQGKAQKKYLQQKFSISLQGDLERLARPDHPREEILSLRFVQDAAGNPPGTDRRSPVLLIGDSHCLVFHDPALHAAGAGLPDHLAAQLGFPVDLLAVRGSGANAVRLALRRRGDNLQGKRLVIWCLAAREFLQAGWKSIGISRRGAEAQREAEEGRQKRGVGSQESGVRRWKQNSPLVSLPLRLCMKHSGR